MAQAVKTVYTYNLDGTKKDFNIPFEYLARKFIRVTLIGKDRKILTLNQDYRFSTKTTITTTQAWGATQGYNYIEIRRYTSATERLVDFTDGSILRAYDLNVSQLQTIHVAEEARDLTADTIGVNNSGDLDARGRRIVNLGYAVSDSDAVPLGQIKGINQNAWTARDQAEAFKNQAKGFRDEAEVSRNAAEAAKARAGASELKAKDWASKDGIVEGGLKSAKTYAQEAKTSEVNAQAAQNGADESRRHASNSQAAAAISQDAADKAKERAEKWAQEAPNVPVVGNRYSAYHWSTVAKTEANKLGNWNALAGQVDLVDGNTVAFKQRLAARNYTVRVDANGEGTAAGVIQFQGTRGVGQKEFYYETYANFSKKRNDIYTFQATDPATWPTGRSAGNGKHSLKGDVEVTKGLNVAGSASVGTLKVANQGVELYGNTPYIDFHYGNNEGDYTHRIIASSDSISFSPNIGVTGNVHANGQLTGTQLNITGGGFVNPSTVRLFSRNGAGRYVDNFVWHSADRGVVMEWGTGYGAGKGYLMFLQRTNENAGAELSVNGNINSYNVTAGGALITHGKHASVQLDVPAVGDPSYILCKTAGQNEWYIGKGGADHNITLHSYRLNTNIILTANTINCNKQVLDRGAPVKRATKGWTQVWAGNMGHGVAGNLSQDIRFRTIWIRIAGENRYMPVQIGPDGQYYVSGWGDGWLKFQVYGNGRGFKNIQDKSTVPNQIMVENE